MWDVGCGIWDMGYGISDGTLTHARSKDTGHSIDHHMGVRRISYMVLPDYALPLIQLTRYPLCHSTSDRSNQPESEAIIPVNASHIEGAVLARTIRT